MLRDWSVSLRLSVLLTLLTGVAYPLGVWGAARTLFPHAAGGSLVAGPDGPVGSELIGLPTDDPADFWGRPSASPGGGSNLAGSNPRWLSEVRRRVERLRAVDPDNGLPIPVELVCASGSGLDPHLSPAGALYQVERVARRRGLPAERVRALVDEAIEPATLGCLGQARVNVLRLNLALDRAAESREAQP